MVNVNGCFVGQQGAPTPRPPNFKIESITKKFLSTCKKCLKMPKLSRKFFCREPLVSGCESLFPVCIYVGNLGYLKFKDVFNYIACMISKNMLLALNKLFGEGELETSVLLA